MCSSKPQIPTSSSHRPKAKTTRCKKLLYWLAVDITVAVLILALLLYRPRRYRPLSGSYLEPGQIHPYLTELSSELYNGAQRRRPFELVIDQRRINHVIAEADWPKQSQGMLLYAPAAIFLPDAIVLMITADVRGAKFVVTIEIKPTIQQQKIFLRVTKVKVGAMNLTPLAKAVAKKMYSERLATTVVDRRAIQTKIAASLLNDEPFDAVFEVDHKKVRLEKIKVQEEKLVLSFSPAS